MAYNNYYNNMNYNRMNNRQASPYGMPFDNRNNNTRRVDMEPDCDRDCDKGNEPVDEMMIGMTYTPWQKWRDLYDVEKGYCCGTIFAELDKPFRGAKCQ